MLTAVIVSTFIAQVYCYWSLGRGHIPYLFQTFVLCGYIYVEWHWAQQQPLMILYVVLNVWGLVNMFRGILRGRL